MSEPTRIQYVGADAAFVETLRDTAPSEWTISMTDGTAVTADELQAFSALVVEDDPPAIDGLEVAHNLAVGGAEIPVLLLGKETDDQRLTAALSDGATDYLPKEAAPADLVVDRLRAAIPERAATAGEAQWSLESVLSRVTDAFFAIDQNWNFTYVNDRAEELLDYEEAELLGENIWDKFTEAVDTTFQREYERAMATEEPVAFEEYYPPLETWFEVRAYPSADGLSVYFRDVNTRKNRERELERYETIVETVGDGVYVLDENSEFMMVNDAYCALSGYDREELLGVHSQEIIGDDFFEQVSEVHSLLEASDETSAVMETDLRTADGDVVPVRATISLFPLADGSHGRVGVVRDISAEKRFERTLAALHDATRQFLGDESREAVARRVLETMTEVVGLPGVAVYLSDEDDVLRPTAHSPYLDEIFGDLSAIEFGPDDSAITRHAYDEGDVITFDDVRETDLTYTEGTPLRSGIWIPLADHGIVGIVSEEVAAFDEEDQRLAELLAATAESVLDRLERDRARERRRQQLESLNDVGQELVTAESRREVCQQSVDAARETLELPITTIERYDEEAGHFVTVAHNGSSGEDENLQLFTGEHDPVWQAYVNSTGAVYDDVLAETEVDAEETEVRSAIVQPLGEHGVLIVGSTERNEFSSDDVALAEILAANTQAVLDRVDHEQQLRDRTETLESKTAALQRLNRINDFIRTITQSLVQASTRSEIDQAVVDNLSQAAPYEVVWVGDSGLGGDSINVRAVSGAGVAHLDRLEPSLDESAEDAPPYVTALETGAPCVEQSIHNSPPLSEWRQTALSAGFGSALSVPVGYGDSIYGVLTVYADEREAFSEMEQSVLGELGEMIGYAINAIERKKALVSESKVELAFAVADADIPALQFVRETGATFDFDMLLSGSDGALRVFFTIDGVDIETVQQFGSQADVVEEIKHISSDGDSHVFEAVTAHDGFIGNLLQHGAQISELTFEGDGGRIVVSLPRDGDVNAFIDMFTSAYEGAELLARRERDQQIQTESQLRQAYRARLTDRQEEVIRTAFFSGFFEWPRESTGQEVAEMLDVSQPTVNRHVRNAERKLFEVVFDDE